MVVSQTQMAVLLVLAAGAIGARRGWGRELVTCSIVLSALLFLQLGGAAILTNLAANAFTSGASASVAGSATCNASGTPTAGAANLPQTTSQWIFAGMVWLGYYAGNRHGALTETMNQRLLGVIPGAITGGAVSFYLNSVLYPGATTLLTWLGAIGFLTSLPVLLSVGLGGALLFLVFTWRAGKSSKAH